MVARQWARTHSNTRTGQALGWRCGGKHWHGEITHFCEDRGNQTPIFARIAATRHPFLRAKDRGNQDRGNQTRQPDTHFCEDRGNQTPIFARIAATRHPFLRGTASTRQASNAVVERWVSAWIIADGLGKFAEAGGDDADARVLGWPEAGTGGIGEDAGVERARKLPLVACASMCPPPITWVLAIPWISGIAGKVGGRRRSCGAGLSMT